ncbi:MAG: GntR family transcriptional regulator [Clostridia bacterium]|nr:GntR family transcriptional regulator [Candidatus Pelethousia sp.]NCB29924.1 GntR family transcriptional regulator [Clostridia bacterium]
MSQFSKKDIIYSQMRQKIINCEYAPSTLLSEARLMEDLGASRTPLREALNKLEQESLVTILPKKGIMTASLSLKDIMDVYHVRLILEPHIIRNWGMDIPQTALLSFRESALSYTGNEPQIQRNQLDDELHRIVINSCPNTYLLQMSRQLYDQNQRIRIFVGQLALRMEINIASHLEIVNHMLAMHFDQAADAMFSHIEEGRNTAIRLLSGQ